MAIKNRKAETELITAVLRQRYGVSFLIRNNASKALKKAQIKNVPACHAQRAQN
jgi:hypothetical protein